jgi:hypothetical protein
MTGRRRRAQRGESFLQVDVPELLDGPGLPQKPEPVSVLQERHPDRRPAADGQTGQVDEIDDAGARQTAGERDDEPTHETDDESTRRRAEKEAVRLSRAG